MHNPKVLVVDEPMVGLDPKSSRILKDLLKKKSQEGVTIFLSTHTLDIAEELCDRIGIILRGQLQGDWHTWMIYVNLRKKTLPACVWNLLFLKLTEEENLAN